MRPASVFSSIQLLNSRTHFRKMDRFLTQIFFLYYSKQYICLRTECSIFV